MKSNVRFFRAILNSLFIANFFQIVTQKFFIVLAIYSKDSNLPNFIACRGVVPNPSFKFHNFTISTERLEILFPGRSTFSTFVSEPTFGYFKLYLLSLVKKMVSLNKFKVQINQFKLKLRIIIEL